MNPSPHALGLPTVYLVDDEDAVRDAMAWLLRSRRLLSEGFASAEAFLAYMQGRTAQGLARYEAEALSDRPVQAIWQDLSERVDGRLSFEFVALANHH